MPFRLCARLALSLALAAGFAPTLASQGVELATRGPRFLAISPAGGKAVDASSAAVLQRRVALDLNGVTIEAALQEIGRQAGVVVMYSKRLLPPNRTVSVQATNFTVAAALTEALLGTGLDVLVSPDGQLALIRKTPEPRPEATAAGAIVGRVTDVKAQTALAGATVVVQGTSRSATTGNDGRYRIAEIPAGTYTVRARYIGYAPGAASVTVSADQEATADFTLEKSAQQLDEVVTTGTVVPTEVRALPVPVTVITSSDVALQRPNTLGELFRRAVPTAVSFEVPGGQYATGFSVRGASTLTVSAGQMKIFVDGIESVSPSVAAVDPNSIERIEVIRGPEAAAIYGSDAIGGVMQIFTKRGDSTLTRPQIDAETAVGLAQTPYPGFGSVVRQHYGGSIRGGASGLSYNFGAGYSRTGDYLPGGELSAFSSPSVYGAVHFARGIITGDVSGRYYTQNQAVVANPDLVQTGLSFFSKPFYSPFQVQHQMMGVNLHVTPVSWWQQTITLGFDRLMQNQVQTRPRLTTPEDTLLEVDVFDFSKASIGYNTTVQSSLGSMGSASLTAGIDHYSYPIVRTFTSSALNGTGTIQTALGTSIGENRTTTTNTGYFAQAQLSLRNALFLTAGVRAEQNSDFGDSVGTPLSPRVGVSYVQAVGGATVKLRGSWGRAIRAPFAGERVAFVSQFNVTLANPDLAPERQQGWDAGVDAAFGGRGSLSVTYYQQTADNLIDNVAVDPTASPPTFQYQNVGRVRNTGVEVEGTLSVGPLQLKGQYGYVRARIEQLAPNYTGDLRIGDQTFTTPKHTAGGSIAVTPLSGMTLGAGASYVGSWRNYDYIAEFSCFGGTGPCQPSTRDYIVAYPAFVKVNATVSQQITRMMSGFISIDNLTNNEVHEFNNANAVMGRTTTVGLRFQY